MDVTVRNSVITRRGSNSGLPSGTGRNSSVATAASPLGARQASDDKQKLAILTEGLAQFEVLNVNTLSERLSTLSMYCESRERQNTHDKIQRVRVFEQEQYRNIKALLSHSHDKLKHIEDALDDIYLEYASTPNKLTHLKPRPPPALDLRNSLTTVSNDDMLTGNATATERTAPPPNSAPTRRRSFLSLSRR